jgi:hypothetical protein
MGDMSTAISHIRIPLVVAVLVLIALLPNISHAECYPDGCVSVVGGRGGSVGSWPSLASVANQYYGSFSYHGKVVAGSERYDAQGHLIFFPAITERFGTLITITVLRSHPHLLLHHHPHHPRLPPAPSLSTKIR